VAALHAVEALPGAGRYAVTFRDADGTEQRAVVHVHAGELDVAEAGLPAGWRRDGAEFAAMAEAVLALHRARSLTSPAAELVDVDGGWDVSLGNVVLTDGAPTCVAHGPMAACAPGRFRCAECGAAARFDG
jgi:hypothetical protein